MVVPFLCLEHLSAGAQMYDQQPQTPYNFMVPEFCTRAVPGMSFCVSITLQR